MRRLWISALLAMTLFFTAASERAQQSAPPSAPQQPEPAPPPGNSEQNPGRITQTVSLVDVLFTVLNRRNKLVPDLEKNDFKIWDDKTPQSIRYFSKQTDLPLRIGLLMDTPNSNRDRMEVADRAGA